MYYQVFVTNVLGILRERKIHKQELAALADISCSFISDILNGKGNPSLKRMGAIANGLHVPLPALLVMPGSESIATDALVPENSLPALPKGFVRKTLVLTSFPAFRAEGGQRTNLRTMTTRVGKPRQRRKPLDPQRAVPRTLSETSQAD